MKPLLDFGALSDSQDSSDSFDSSDSGDSSNSSDSFHCLLFAALCMRRLIIAASAMTVTPIHSAVCVVRNGPMLVQKRWPLQNAFSASATDSPIAFAKARSNVSP